MQLSLVNDVLESVVTFIWQSIKTLGKVCKCADMLSLSHTPMFCHKSVPVMFV